MRLATAATVVPSEPSHFTPVTEGGVVFRGVQVEKGADVENCILFKGTVVKKGAIMRHVITDKHVVISENRTLMGSENYPLVIGRDTEV